MVFMESNKSLSTCCLKKENVWKANQNSIKLCVINPPIHENKGLFEKTDFSQTSYYGFLSNSNISRMIPNLYLLYKNKKDV